MQNCSNCYNGCVETVSDRCVKYTDVPVPVLGIQTGDSLSYVEQAIITFLTSVIELLSVFLNNPTSPRICWIIIIRVFITAIILVIIIYIYI